MLIIMSLIAITAAFSLILYNIRYLRKAWEGHKKGVAEDENS